MNATDERPVNARNKSNYIAAKAAFNARDLDLCLTFYAREHQIMSRPAPPGREHIRAFLAGTLAGTTSVTTLPGHSPDSSTSAIVSSATRRCSSVV